MCSKTDSRPPDDSIYQAPSSQRKSICKLQCGVTTISPQKRTGPDCFGHCRCWFSCHSLQPLSSPFCPILPLFCFSLSLLQLSLSFSLLLSLSPLPPFPALPERPWPLASLSLCHVCNLNCAGAKAGLGPEKKAFHKTRAEALKSLWTLFSEEWNGAAHSHFLQSAFSISASGSDIRSSFTFSFRPLLPTISHTFLSIAVLLSVRQISPFPSSLMCCCKTLPRPLSCKHRLRLHPYLISLTGGRQK